MFNMKLGPIKSSNNVFLIEELFKPEEPVFDKYTTFKLPIGFVRNYYNPEKDMKKVFCIDVTEAFRMLHIAKTRSGKSFFMRAIMDRLKKCGYSICYLTDTKNEFQTSEKPLQIKFHPKLIKGEQTGGTLLKTFRPTFFQGLEGHAKQLNVGQRWASMEIAKLQPADFATLMSALGMTEMQARGIKRLVKEAAREGITITTYQEFERLIEQSELQNKQNILDKLYDLTEFNPFDLNHHIKPHMYLRDGYTVVLNLEYFESLGKDNGFIQTFIVSWMRDIINARIQKMIPPAMMVLDETPRFVPVNGESIVKSQVLESIDLHTAYHINYSFASQDIVSIPERLVRQCRYIFIPWNVNYEVMKDAFKIANLAAAEVKAQQYNELRRLTSRMRERDWVAIDANNKTYEFITPLAPLTQVRETAR